jgi:hypothetical protein
MWRGRRGVSNQRAMGRGMRLGGVPRLRDVYSAQPARALLHHPAELSHGHRDIADVRAGRMRACAIACHASRCARMSSSAALSPPVSPRPEPSGAVALRQPSDRHVARHAKGLARATAPPRALLPEDCRCSKAPFGFMPGRVEPLGQGACGETRPKDGVIGRQLVDS